MKSRLLAAIAAVALAGIGVFLVLSYAQGADTRAMQQLEPVDTLVVIEAVPAGTPVEALADFLTLKALPSANVPGSALRSLKGTGGQVTAADLVPGEPLVSERLVDAAELTAPGSVPVPEGLQEVTFALDPQRVVGGKVAAGDTVGIFGSFDSGALPADPSQPTTQQVFHKVLVTSVQRAEAASAEPVGADVLPSGTMLATVAVSDEDATRLIFVGEFGRMWLTKEPDTATEGNSPVVRKDTVLQ
jgi:pilus assembly protein CpaB